MIGTTVRFCCTFGKAGCIYNIFNAGRRRYCYREMRQIIEKPEDCLVERQIAAPKVPFRNRDTKDTILAVAYDEQVLKKWDDAAASHK